MSTMLSGTLTPSLLQLVTARIMRAVRPFSRRVGRREKIRDRRVHHKRRRRHFQRPAVSVVLPPRSTRMLKQEGSETGGGSLKL